MSDDEAMCTAKNARSAIAYGAGVTHVHNVKALNCSSVHGA